MANKTRTYQVTWSYKEDGNRELSSVDIVSATTVQRAISKLVRTLNDEDPDRDDYKTSDFLFIDVRATDPKLEKAIKSWLENPDADA